MSASIEVERIEVARKLRALADHWRSEGTPNIVACTLALYVAFGVENMRTCDGFEVIANFLDPDHIGEGTFGEMAGEIECRLDALLSED